MTNDECGMTNFSKGPGALRWVMPGASRKAAAWRHVSQREEALMHFAHHVTEARDALTHARLTELPPEKAHWLRAARTAGNNARWWMMTARKEWVINHGEGVAA